MDVALFSPASLFGCDDEGEDPQEAFDASQHYVERTHAFNGMDLTIREFSFHQLNANLLWPGTFEFSRWLVENQSILHGARTLELGSGTGALAIFLRKSLGVDITTSDYDDKEIEDNIAHNCTTNQLAVLPHLRHSWGDVFPIHEPDWDIIIASDILLYVKQYPKLIKTLCFLLKAYRPRETVAGISEARTFLNSGTTEVLLRFPLFLMSWRRRIGTEEEKLFFKGCEDAGLTVRHLGSRVYLLH